MRTSSPKLTPLKKMFNVHPSDNSITLEDEIGAGLNSLRKINSAGSKVLKALLTQYTIATLQIVGEENAGKIPKHLRLKQVDLSKKLFRKAKNENLFQESQLAVAGIIQAIDVVSDQGVAMQTQGQQLQPSHISPQVGEILALALGSETDSNWGAAQNSPYAANFSNPIFKVAGIFLIFWAITSFR